MFTIVVELESKTTETAGAERFLNQKILLKVNYKTASTILFRFITNLDEPKNDNLMSNYQNKYITFLSDTIENDEYFKKKLFEANDYVIATVKNVQGFTYTLKFNQNIDGLYLKFCNQCLKYKMQITSNNDQCYLKCNYCGNNNKYKINDLSSLYGHNIS